MTNEKKWLQFASRVFFIFLALILFVYILYHKLSPFGAARTYSYNPKKEELKLGPLDRAVQEKLDGQDIQKQFSDLAYFTTLMPYKYDYAKVRITFKNPYDDQPLYLGFQDQESWHYQTKLIDYPLLNDSKWIRTNSTPSIFQHTKMYDSYLQFIENPPLDSAIGIFNFDKNILKQNFLSDYQPSNVNTIIDTPLRGRVVFYTYVYNEPFKLKIWKQDLNFYPDPDIVNVRIYKENDVVYHAQIDDDGITDESGKVLSTQEVYIENPGPELPEPGIYKVVIDASSDIVISRFETNLHKIVFDSPIFPISNHEVYPEIAESTKSNSFISDALGFSALTYHGVARQTINIGNSNLELKVKEEVATDSSEPLVKITLPKSDVILKGLLGYFAFTEDQYFKPSKFKLLQLNQKRDADVVDFVIADYKPSISEGEFRVAEADFDLTSAFVNKSKLSWIVKIPGLKEKEREIIIRNIEIKLSKKPLIK